MARRKSDGGIYGPQKRFFREAYRTGVHGWPTEGPTRQVLEFLGKLKREGVAGRFLDLGCGEGRHLIPFAQAGFRCEGLDLEPLALKKAALHLRKAGVASRVRLRKGDALHLPYGRDSFDVVLDCGCFHHIRKSDEKVFLQNLLRVLKPGGTFILTVFDVHFRHSAEERAHTRRRWIVHRGHYDRFFTGGEIRSVFGREFEIQDLKRSGKGLDKFWHVRMKSREGR